MHKVLIVEDDEELRRLYKEIFSTHNFTVFEAGDGQTGVDSALMNRPDIVILDLMMPRQGGIGALRIIRTLPELKTMPVIVLTALNNPEYKEMTKNWVQGYYLKAQIKPKELVGQVLQLLNRK